MTTEKQINDRLGIKLLAASMGKVFRVTAICKSKEDANEVCARHSDWGVISEDQESGLVFIAELWGPKVPTEVLSKLYQ